MQDDRIAIAEAKPEAKEGKSGGVSRRSFIKGLAATGAGLAFFSSTTRIASAQYNRWATDLKKEKLAEMYTKMQRSRQWEQRMKDLFLEGKDKLYGAFHIYVGEEAVAVGAISALNEDDYILSTHRGHGHLIAKGGDVRQMSAEIFFKETGYNKGYGGSMHITDLSKGILGMNGIVGPQYLLGAGAAYGALVRGSKQVAMAFGGDGSIASPYLSTALSRAAKYKLPLIVVIENNGFAIQARYTTLEALPDLAQRADGYGVPSAVVDGQDVLAVYSAAKEAVERARSGGGPTLIEAKTVRFYDHAGFSGARVGQLGAFGLPYRSDWEVRQAIARDPIPRFRRFLTDASIFTEEELQDIEASVKREVDESVDFARASADPKPQNGLLNVYSEGAVRASQFLA